MNPEDCPRENFDAHVAVHRLGDGAGTIRNFMADITAQCSNCGTPFHFVGVPAGLSFRRPMVDVAATTMHAPIAPGPAPLPSGLVIEVGGPPS